MTTSFKLLIAFFLIVSCTYGQTTNLILTPEQNAKWLDSLKSLTLNKQLISVKERLLADTNIFIKLSYPDRIKVVEQKGNKVYGEGKPTIIISGYPIIIDNKTKPEKVVRFADLLTTDNIKKVYILSPNDKMAAALYGSAALDGIITMTVTKNKYLKKFKQLKLEPNY